MRESHIKINCCYTGYKINCKCHNCGKKMNPGEIYFNLTINSSNYGNPDFMIKFCKECWGGFFNNSLKDYDNKKENYGVYLKKKIAKNL